MQCGDENCLVPFCACLGVHVHELAPWVHLLQKIHDSYVVLLSKIQFNSVFFLLIPKGKLYGVIWTVSSESLQKIIAVVREDLL